MRRASTRRFGKKKKKKNTTAKLECKVVSIQIQGNEHPRHRYFSGQRSLHNKFTIQIRFLNFICII